jgi:nitroreductase/SAM-dependent methyltransferase
MADELEGPGPRDPAGDIPEEPAGDPTGGARGESDAGRPVGPAPPMDFWEALYGRRSIRKFAPRPVPREMVDQVMHAGTWAPSSCNYQMWDLVAVDDPELNVRLGEISLQMKNAPVNIVVSYGRAFSEEAWANIQSASAMIQNMSLAAHVLGLGTFWITQMGDAEEVREIVGLPYDRLVIAVLALGYPRFAPKNGPKRRPLSQVTHWNHYAGEPIPSSPDPSRWSPDLLAIYQRARVLTGLRHNKPRPWETRAVLEMLAQFIPPGESAAGRWLDVLPCTGILTERLSRERKDYTFDVAERSPEVAAFAAHRARPQAGPLAWHKDDAAEGFPAPRPGTYDVVTCLFRLEGLPPEARAGLLADIAAWLAPGGVAVIGFVSRSSFHDWTERMRARRGGPGGVEYVLSPDPNIGPFESLAPNEVERLAAQAGLEVSERLGLQAVPAEEELSFRARNFGPRNQRLVLAAGRVLRLGARIPGVESARGRFRFLKLRKS